MHPYKHLPQENFWRNSVSSQIWSEINFMPVTKFKLSVEDRIATAGSCFAQHIAKNLNALGLTHFVSEKPPQILSPERSEALQYGVFSARYGNIYTARQLRQLIEFAFGDGPQASWPSLEGNRWFDLLRPSVSPQGFESVHDLECDREFHLDRVKNLFLEADCFVFTLGLTEAWFDQDSGVVFPVCPGTKVGKYNPLAHKFINFGFPEITEDLHWCINFVRRYNPEMKWIFTVSPVALAATATSNHVLIATSVSKSILRAAADDVCSRHENCEYFPSYEICASVSNFGQFLDSDLRSISPRGVKLVMQVFQRAFCSDQPSVEHASVATLESVSSQIKAAAAAECDEIFNDPTNLSLSGVIRESK